MTLSTTRPSILDTCTKCFTPLPPLFLFLLHPVHQAVLGQTPPRPAMGQERVNPRASDGIAPKLSNPPRRPTLAFPIGSLFGHFLANSFPTTSSSSFLSSATFRPPGPLPQHVKDNITPLVYEQLLIAQNVLECAISTSTSTSASNIEEVYPSQPE